MIPLILYLAAGGQMQFQINPVDCETHIAVSRAAVASGGYATVEGPGVYEIIVRLQCGGHDVVLALPPTEGDCEGVS